jgi:acetolactate synthase-1/2/3 large subunit
VVDLNITAAEALLKVMEEEGVKHIFGYPGGAILPVYDALKDFQNLKHILVRHEQAAVHAASGYARSTGKVGVAMATSGPGATNLITGIANAYMDSIPVVIITGQVPTVQVGSDAFQEVDITGITMPITKHNYLIKNPHDVSRIVKEAFYIASTGRPGPVLIDLPRDVAETKINYEPLEKVELRGYKPTYKGHSLQIKKIVQLLEEKEKPLLFIGGGVVNSGAHLEVKELAEKCQIPVITTLMGLGALAEDHPLYVGMVGLHGLPAANLVLQECDLLLSLGVRFDDRVTSNIEKFAPNAKIIHIDIDPAEIGKNVRVDLPLVGDIKVVLNDLTKRIAPLQHSSWLKRVEKLKAKYYFSYPENKEGKIVPQKVIRLLGEITNHEAIVTTDVGEHQMWAAQFYSFRRPGQFLTSGGLGAMGFGFPAAIGAQVGNPNSLVISITGDGSFQMNMAELGTAKEHNLPIKILLFNNKGLGMVRQLQQFYCDERYYAVEFKNNPDFVKLAGAFECVGLRMEKEEEIEPILKKALTIDNLVLIECMIESTELVYPMVTRGGGLNEMIVYKEGAKNGE